MISRYVAGLETQSRGLRLMIKQKERSMSKRLNFWLARVSLLGLCVMAYAMGADDAVKVKNPEVVFWVAAVLTLLACAPKAVERWRFYRR